MSNARLWRGLLPSWRLFDTPGPPHELLLRMRDSNGVWGEWRRCIPYQNRRAWHLLFHPQGNLRLAAWSAVNDFLQEAAEAPPNSDLRQNVSYRLLLRLVVSTLPGSCSFQFKVAEVHDSTFEDVFISAVHESPSP